MKANLTPVPQMGYGVFMNNEIPARAIAMIIGITAHLGAMKVTKVAITPPALSLEARKIMPIQQQRGYGGSFSI